MHDFTIATWVGSYKCIERISMDLFEQNISLYFFARIKMGQGPKKHCKSSLVSSLVCFWLKFFLSVCLNFTQSKCSLTSISLNSNTGASYATMYVNHPSQHLIQSGCRGEFWGSTYIYLSRFKRGISIQRAVTHLCSIILWHHLNNV